MPAVAIVLGVAAALRVVAVPCSPPGLNQDEAANAWNAWCLLKTGVDQAGEPWPIFFTRGLGAPTTTPFIYWMIPFQAAWGLNIWTIRMPSAALGVLTVAASYYVGARLFGRNTGLLAAALLAISPWHVVLTRWGHEVSLAPFATLMALAAMLWARLPIADGMERPHPWRALLAGALIGALCYGYGAIRLFLPAFVLATILAAAPAWLRTLRDHCGRTSAALFILGLAATLAPLAVAQLSHGPEMTQRAAAYWIMRDGRPPAEAIREIAKRYVAHFGPDFLFQRGDLYLVHHAPATGVLGWPMLPLMLVGAAAALCVARRSAAARIVLCGLLLYPLGDSLLHFWVYPDHGEPIDSLHLLRSSPGLPMLTLVAGLGGATLLSGLTEPLRFAPRRGAVATGAALLMAAVLSDARQLYIGLVARGRDPETRIAFHHDLVTALTTLRDRVEAADAVFITASKINMPYILTLVTLGYDPARWRADVKASQPSVTGEWEEYTRVGKFRFIYDAAAFDEIRALQQNGTPDNVLFIVRPGELKVGEPIRVFSGPDGAATLAAYELAL